jgi:outer membrane receptor for ferrienterochelin and colicin
MDLPRLTRYMAYNKWRYGNEADNGFSMQAGLRVTTEQRIGGQTNAGHNEGSTTAYEQCIHYVQPEGYVKARWRFSPAHVVAISVMGQQQRQQAWFGTTSYTAQQRYAWVNAQHEWQWHAQHQLKYGVGYRYQQLTEDIAFTGPALGRTYAGSYNTKLSVPGVFAENTFRWLGDKLNLIAGLRADQHQQWGTYVTPRGMVRYAASSRHTFRASGGSGWRQVFLFPEQVNLLASSRNVVFEEALKPEQAVNWGVSHVYRLNGRVLSGTIATDYYSTRFSNQFFPDYDTDPTKAIIRNFTGPSRSNALQVDANLVLLRMVEVRMAYNYLQVYREINGEKTQLPFNPTHRAMGAVSYTTANRRWQADANVHWYDRMRLPDTRSNPEPYRRPLWSVPYTTLAVQLTWRWRTLDVYAGCENITNYRQPNPIISADNPFGPYFDLSSVWGPVRGRELYMGIRYAIR